MRWVWLALLLSAAPASAQAIDPATAYLMWDFNATETAVDPAQPGAPPVVITPTPADAAAMLYNIGFFAPGFFPGVDVHVDGVTCTAAGCRTPPLSVVMPQLAGGGNFVLKLKRANARLPWSDWSQAVSFSIRGTDNPPPPPPPPPACLVSAFGEWSPWLPFVPQVTPPLETRHRDRTITNMPCAGTPFLTETENRLITTAPPACTCQYVTPAGALTPLACGEVKSGLNAFPSISRNDQLLSMGMELKLRKISPTQVQMDATCVGVPGGGV